MFLDRDQYGKDLIDVLVFGVLFSIVKLRRIQKAGMGAGRLLGFLVKLLAIVALAGILFVDVWTLTIAYANNPPEIFNSLDGWFPYPPGNWSDEILGAASGIAALVISYAFVTSDTGAQKVVGVTPFGLLFILISLLLLVLSYVANSQLTAQHDVILCEPASDACLTRISQEGYDFLHQVTSTSWKLLVTIVGVAVGIARKAGGAGQANGAAAPGAAGTSGGQP